MKLLFFCPIWGSTDLPLETFLDRVKASGYDGVEVPLPLEDGSQRIRLLKAIADRGLTWIGQHYDTASPDPDAHLAEYCRRLENLAAAGPLLLNTQTGKDWFTDDQNRRLIDAAAEIAARTGVKIVHETHRGKFSFNAQVTARFLAADPALRIAADFSHWCVVSESLLEDQSEALDLAIARADHIHARVGHAEGPQVSDPRAPEWQAALAAHLGWWDRIVAAHRQAGDPLLTISPEFGPPPYLPTLPYSNLPVASQWDLNVGMMNLLRERYA